MTEQRNILGTVGPRFDAAIVTRALLSGDGTYSLTSGQRYTGDGILVAIPGVGLVLEKETAELIPAAIAQWIENYAAPAIHNFPAPFFRPRFLGSWIDPETGIVYLDIVEAFSREEKEAAIAAGIARDQIAIWDNGRQELIETGGTGAVD